MPPAPTRSDSLRIRSALLAEARAMLEADGHPVALNALARRAGVGVGTVYRHFPTSQALLEAVAFEALEQLRAELVEAAGDPDPWAGLERVVRAQVRMEVAHVGVREVLATAVAADPRTAAAMTDMAGLVEALLGRAWDAGVLHARVGAADLRNILCGVGYTAGLVPERAEATAAFFADVVLRGLRARPESLRTTSS
ncbi:TetR/AcrR family transcriptional regulator [Dactylosporangium sp. CA-139066]|uniref:TetR/AcrR family transcriptional regulator n=1 Tax=Dactylosporangium sp. CA-139066 TaxID=3239930 RepID=UPI003D918F38